jgi:hypothetical protein
VHIDRRRWSHAIKRIQTTADKPTESRNPRPLDGVDGLLENVKDDYAVDIAVVAGLDWR